MRAINITWYGGGAAFWQRSDTLNAFSSVRSGGSVGGVQATNAVAGTVTAGRKRHPPPPSLMTPPAMRDQRAR